MDNAIKKEKEFKKFVNKRNYQIFLISSRVTFPAFFAKHYWFVSNQKGRLKRLEIYQVKNNDSQLGYLWINNKNFSRALNKYFWNRKIYWKRSKIERIISGKKAKDFIKVLEKSIKNYPFKKKYLFYPGPNSNTYVKWIINKFPELNIKLSWNAFGKNYKN